MTKMFDENLAASVHTATTSTATGHYYRTNLPDLERDFIERRPADEQSALGALAAETFPATFALPKHLSSTSSIMGTAS
jgi:hypothetical protein